MSLKLNRVIIGISIALLYWILSVSVLRDNANVLTAEEALKPFALAVPSTGTEPLVVPIGEGELGYLVSQGIVGNGQSASKVCAELFAQIFDRGYKVVDLKDMEDSPVGKLEKPVCGFSRRSSNKLQQVWVTQGRIVFQTE